MRTIVFALSTVLVLMTLAACTVSSEDTDDDSVEADTTETPVMNSQQTDDESDDSATDEADSDDATDGSDAETDDATDEADETSDDADTEDATDDADAETDDASDDASDESSEDGSSDDEDAAEPVEHMIEIVEGNLFSPDQITIAPGDTVTWVNQTDQVHTSSADPEIATDESHVQLPEGAEIWHSGNIEPGEEYSVTLDVPGTYTYFCYPHQDGGMIGTIVVEGADDEGDTDTDEQMTDDSTDDGADGGESGDDDTSSGDGESGEAPATEEQTGVGGDRQYTGKDSVN